MTDSPRLSVVIPVYNEAKNLLILLERWTSFLLHQGISFEFILVNDGSTDQSAALLAQWSAQYPFVQVFTQENKGHGPAIRLGYTKALESEWVFQLDADSPYDTAAFEEMWRLRLTADFWLGEADHKNAAWFRRLISSIAVRTVQLTCGTRLRSINSPYRLMRTEDLRVILPQIPAESFAVNIMVSMYYIRHRKKIRTLVVNTIEGTAARKSRINTYFLKGALVSFWQIIQYRTRL